MVVLQVFTYRVGAHGPEVRGEGEEGKRVENGSVDQAVDQILGGQQHHKHHHKGSVEDQQPGDDGADDAAGVPDEPHGRGRGGSDDVFGDGDSLLSLQVVGHSARGTLASSVFHVPASVHGVLHPSSELAERRRWPPPCAPLQASLCSLHSAEGQ